MHSRGAAPSCRRVTARLTLQHTHDACASSVGTTQASSAPSGYAPMSSRSALSWRDVSTGAMSTDGALRPTCSGRIVSGRASRFRVDVSPRAGGRLSGAHTIARNRIASVGARVASARAEHSSSPEAQRTIDARTRRERSNSHRAGVGGSARAPESRLRVGDRGITSCNRYEQDRKCTVSVRSDHGSG